MREYIKKIQSKSEVERKQILVISIVFCMTIVFFIWISTLGSHFNKKEVMNDTSNKEEVEKPFAIFGKNIKDTYNNISASVNSISSAINKETEEIDENSKVIDLIPVEHTNQ
jgi:hypothetical protein